jgi:hypothetical protein
MFIQMVKCPFPVNASTYYLMQKTWPRHTKDALSCVCGNAEHHSSRQAPASRHRKSVKYLRKRKKKKMSHGNFEGAKAIVARIAEDQFASKHIALGSDELKIQDKRW